MLISSNNVACDLDEGTSDFVRALRDDGSELILRIQLVIVAPHHKDSKSLIGLKGSAKISFHVRSSLSRRRPATRHAWPLSTSCSWLRKVQRL